MKKLLLSLSLIAAVGATAFAGPPGWRNGKTVDVQGRSQQGPPGWLKPKTTWPAW